MDLGGDINFHSITLRSSSIITDESHCLFTLQWQAHFICFQENILHRIIIIFQLFFHVKTMFYKKVSNSVCSSIAQVFLRKTFMNYNTEVLYNFNFVYFLKMCTERDIMTLIIIIDFSRTFSSEFGTFLIEKVWL